MEAYERILLDDPALHVPRVTLNRPEKRNATRAPNEEGRQLHSSEPRCDFYRLGIVQHRKMMLKLCPSIPVADFAVPEYALPRIQARSPVIVKRLV